jgi:hypothetical protein
MSSNLKLRFSKKATQIWSYLPLTLSTLVKTCLRMLLSLLLKVSLILALWEEIQPPFRMLDEFDVFMDMMNRNKSVEMILDFARENRDFQYFFLTPLDTNMLDKPEYKKDVSVQTVIKNDD